MPSYDAVLGADTSTLNSLIATFYKTVYPNFLKHEFSIDKLSFSTILVDVQAAPTATLAPSAAAHAKIEQALAAPTGKFAQLARLTTDVRASLVKAAASASFDLVAPQVQFTLNYQGGGQPTVVQGGVTVSAVVQTSAASGHNYLTLQAVAGSVSIPGAPEMESIVNQGLVPSLLGYINEFLQPIEVPALELNTASLSMPVPAVQNGYLLAFSALGAAQPDVPEPHGWPTGKAFAGFDTAALAAAANALLPKALTDFDWTVIDGTVGAILGPVSAGDITINADGSIALQIPCQAEAQLTFHTPPGLPNFTFGPRATAFVSGTATPLVAGGALLITLNRLNAPTFEFSMGTITDWALALLGPLRDAMMDQLNDTVWKLIGPFVSNKIQIPVMERLSVPLTLDDTSYTLGLAQAVTSAGQGPNGTLLLVTGQPTFTRAAPPAAP